jgi:hypothetical protein
LLVASAFALVLSNDTHGNLLSVVSFLLLFSSSLPSNFLLLSKLVLSDLLLLHLVDEKTKSPQKTSQEV